MKISFTNTFKLAFTLALSLCMTGAFAQAVLTVNNSAAAGTYSDVGTASFGPQTFGITGDLVAAQDGVPANSVTDACEPINNGLNVTGNIALIDRGDCNFTDKVINAETVGAIAVIICNNVANDGAPGMGSAPGFVDNIGIDVISLSFEFCNEIKAEMATETVNITIRGFNVSGSSAAYATQTPIDQVLPLNDIQIAFQNRGSEDQYGLELKCDITDPAGTVTTLEITEEIDTLPPGSWIATFNDSYTPTMVGEYTTRFYNNGAATTNYIEGINEESSKFYITDDVFSHDGGDNAPVRLGIGRGRFDMGSVFQITGTTDALSTTFAIAEPDSLADDDILSLIIYKLDTNGDGNIDEDGDGMFTDTDLGDILGFSPYDLGAVTAPQAHEEITIDMSDYVNGGLLKLEGTKENPGIYMLTIQYFGSNTSSLYLSSPNRIVHSPIMSITDNTGVTVGVGNTFARNSAQWFTGGFDGESQVILRLNVAEVVGINQPELEEGAVNVMPNPASEQVNIMLDFAELATTVDVSLLDITGRVLRTDVYNNVQQQTVNMDVSQYAAGTYFVHVRTTEGRKTLRLVVGK